MTQKLTKREKFELILNLAEVQANEEYKTFLEDEIAALDARAAKAKERAAAKRAEVDTLGELVFDIIAENESVTIQDILNSIDDEEVTSAKVVSRLTKLVKADRIEKKEVTIDKSKRMTYTIKAN